MNFDGETYDPTLDKERLTTQFIRVLEFMRDGRFHTLSEISYQCKGTEASVSARLRDARKKKHGGYTVERRRVSGGLFEYRLVIVERAEGLSGATQLEMGL